MKKAISLVLVAILVIAGLSNLDVNASEIEGNVSSTVSTWTSDILGTANTPTESTWFKEEDEITSYSVRPSISLQPEYEVSGTAIQITSTWNRPELETPILTVSGTVTGSAISVSGYELPEDGFVIASDIDFSEDISGHTTEENTPWISTSTEVETVGDTITSTAVEDSKDNTIADGTEDTVDLIGPPISYDEWLTIPKIVKGKKNEFTIRSYETIKLQINTKKKIKWSSKNKNVATVNKKGKVTAKGVGTTYIIGKYGKKTVKVKITVIPYIYVDQEIICMNTNDTEYIMVNTDELPSEWSVIQPDKINLDIEVTEDSKLAITAKTEGIFEVPISIYSKKGLVTEYMIPVIVSDNITEDSVIFDSMTAVGKNKYTFTIGNIVFTTSKFDIARDLSESYEVIPYYEEGSEIEQYKFSVNKKLFMKIFLEAYRTGKLNIKKIEF